MCENWARLEISRLRIEISNLTLSAPVLRAKLVKAIAKQTVHFHVNFPRQ